MRTATASRIAARKKFFENVEPPYICFGCGCEITEKSGPRRGQLVVHHVDENPFNNDLDNLSPAHSECHTAHHATGRGHTEEARAKIGAAFRGTTLTDEHKAKISATKAARLVRKTHCTNGHEFTPENTYKARGGRSFECRICRKARRSVARAALKDTP